MNYTAPGLPNVLMDIGRLDPFHSERCLGGNDKAHTPGPIWDFGEDCCYDDKIMEHHATRVRREQSQRTGKIPVVARSDEDGDDIISLRVERISGHTMRDSRPYMSRYT